MPKCLSGETVWDTCRYITRCNSMGRTSISPDHANTERGYLVNRIRPYFENRKMGSITRKDIEGFVIDVKQKVSVDGKGKRSASLTEPATIS